MTTSAHTPLTVTAARLESGVVLRLVGELDYETTAALTRAVRRHLEDGPGQLRLNCAELTYIDTTGLSGLLEVRRRADAAGCELYLDERPPRLQRLLEITGTLEHLTGAPAADPVTGERRATLGPGQARSDA